MHIRLRTTIVVAATAATIGSCSDNRVETPSPPRDTVAVSTPSAQADSLRPAIDSVGLQAVTGATPTSPLLTPLARAKAIGNVQEFIHAIDSSDKATFWRMLSRRSLNFADNVAPKDEIWKAARETLGDIQDRKVTVIGGSRDSVALLVEGMRLEDGTRVDDPIIMHLLREGDTWKVMYPGLLYPRHHLRR